MTERATHTWDLFLRYHRCPACGKIIESRKDFSFRDGLYEKELECPRCGKPVEVRRVFDNYSARRN